MSSLTDLRSLNTVLQREQAARDAAHLALRDAQQRLAQVTLQADALHAHRRETLARWGVAAGVVTGVQQLQTTGQFVSRLEDVQSQQALLQQRAAALAEQRRAVLGAAERRVAMVRKLIERREATLARQRQRREQIEADELAQRMGMRAPELGDTRQGEPA